MIVCEQILVLFLTPDSLKWFILRLSSRVSLLLISQDNKIIDYYYLILSSFLLGGQSISLVDLGYSIV